MALALDGRRRHTKQVRYKEGARYWIPCPKTLAYTVTLVNCSLGKSADFPVQFCKSHICWYRPNAWGHSGSSVWEMTQLPFYCTFLPAEQCWGHRHRRSHYVYFTSWLFSEPRGQKLIPCSSNFKGKITAGCLPAPWAWHELRPRHFSPRIWRDIGVPWHLFPGWHFKCPALYNLMSLLTDMCNGQWRQFRSCCCFVE